MKRMANTNSDTKSIIQPVISPDDIKRARNVVNDVYIDEIVFSGKGSGTGCTPPTVSISPTSATIEEGGSQTLTASGADSYSWDNGLGTGATKNLAE